MAKSGGTVTGAASTGRWGMLCRMANSSAPRRATRSPGPTACSSRRATSQSSASPCSWPIWSLASLKKSRSRKSTAQVVRLRGCSSRRSSRERSSSRLASPVRESWVASWVSRASARRRSVMSSEVVRMQSGWLPPPPGTGGRNGVLVVSRMRTVLVRSLISSSKLGSALPVRSTSRSSGRWRLSYASPKASEGRRPASAAGCVPARRACSALTNT